MSRPLAALVLLLASPSLADDPLETARVHLQKGRYAEALEAYDELAEQKADPAKVAIGRSLAHEAEGRWAEATDALAKAAKAAPDDPDLQARLAEILFRQGRYEEAEKAADAALEADPKHPRAKLVQADLFTETGRTKEAGEGYRWFVRYYNQAQPTDAETLLLVARGAAQYARWNSVSQIFSFAVNDLAPDALEDDELCWQAYQISGDLLLEKYNEAQGIPELKSALAINPRAAEALVSLGNAALDDLDLEEAEEYADQALEINPHLPSAHVLKADLRIHAGEYPAALEAVKAAREVNPRDQRALAREAACYLLVDPPLPDGQLEALLTGLDAIDSVAVENPGRFASLVVELARRNPRPGYFLAALGKTMEGRRQFAAAETILLAATEVMPQLSEPKTALGMLYMRTGRIERAGEILDTAFKADPYHVRVSNLRKVLDVLGEYDAIETDHFIVRFDSERDRILAEYMAEYLEEVYPRLVRQFGYAPPGKTQFEIYNEAKGESGHSWFSARLTGLPWIQTIGATTGMIVAMTSPHAGDDEDGAFNWAQVVRHEYTHVITLQQTNFNIPHWFTEALAVREEGTPRPAVWNQLLLERVPKGELTPLDKLTDGFVRPGTSPNWQFAYCQSELYADYMVEAYGEESLAKLLEAYRENLPTAQAVRYAFGVDQPAFEKGYREYVEGVVAKLQGGKPEPRRTLAELERAHEADPDDPRTAGAYALELLKLKKAKQARELAEGVLEQDPTQPLAALVIAQLAIQDEEVEDAVAALKPALDRDDPHPKVLELLAKLRLHGEEYEEAEALYELGRQRFPDDLDWLRGLAACYLKRGETGKLRETLAALAEQDPEDAETRKRLAQLAFEDENYADAIKYGRLALHINVRDAAVHHVLADSYRATGNREKALREYRVLLELDPDNEEAQEAVEELER